MKLQRYKMCINSDNETEVCKSEDVEKLEQLNAEILTDIKYLISALLQAPDTVWLTDYQTVYEFLESIIKKAETMK